MWKKSIFTGGEVWVSFGGYVACGVDDCFFWGGGGSLCVGASCFEVLYEACVRQWICEQCPADFKG